MSTEYDYLFKFVVTGDSGVGKSSLITRFADNTYQDGYIATIGVDFRIRTLYIDGKSVKLQIWDTAGQERFRTLICSYYRGAHGIVIVFDITNEASFQNVRHWLEEVERHADENVCKVIVGNKSDLAAQREVDWMNAYEFATKFCSESSNYIECSAKTSNNVTDVFTRLGTQLIAQNKGRTYVDEPYPCKLDLTSSSIDDRKNFDCCL